MSRAKELDLIGPKFIEEADIDWARSRTKTIDFNLAPHMPAVEEIYDGMSTISDTFHREMAQALDGAPLDLGITVHTGYEMVSNMFPHMSRKRLFLYITDREGCREMALQDIERFAPENVQKLWEDYFSSLRKSVAALRDHMNRHDFHRLAAAYTPFTLIHDSMSQEMGKGRMIIYVDDPAEDSLVQVTRDMNTEEYSLSKTLPGLARSKTLDDFMKPKRGFEAFMIRKMEEANVFLIGNPGKYYHSDMLAMYVGNYLQRWHDRNFPRTRVKPAPPLMYAPDGEEVSEAQLEAILVTGSNGRGPSS